MKYEEFEHKCESLEHTDNSPQRAHKRINIYKNKNTEQAKVDKESTKDKIINVYIIYLTIYT